MSRVTVCIPDETAECKVVIARIDSDGCEADVIRDVFYGSREACCDYMRKHRLVHNQKERYGFAIVYVASGRYASYML